jgi:hypothetical protein
VAAVYSYNGWLASPTPAVFGGLAPLVVAGESFAPGVRAGDVRTVLGYVAEQLHLRVEPVVRAEWHQADDWGFSFRPNRNANNLSCHASGTAFDYNATRHPNGKRGTFTPAQVAEIKAILAEVRHAVQWGGAWGPGSTPDEMHFEIAVSPAQLAVIAADIRAGRIRGRGTTATKKGLPKMIERRLVKGSNVGRVGCPVGSVSELVAAAWVSVTVQGGASGRIAFQRSAESDAAPPGAGPLFDFTARNAARPWKSIPSGTEYIEYWIDAKGDGSLLIEMKPK